MNPAPNPMFPTRPRRCPPPEWSLEQVLAYVKALDPGRYREPKDDAHYPQGDRIHETDFTRQARGIHCSSKRVRRIFR